MQETAVRTNGRRVPDLTIETLARGFFREAERYGFDQTDYLRFVNRLLDLSMGVDGSVRQPEDPWVPDQPGVRTVPRSLPIEGDALRIRAFERSRDLPLLRRWLEDHAGRHFLDTRMESDTVSLEKTVDDPATVLGIITLMDGTPVGAMAFLHVDPVQGKGELRKLVGEPTMRGKGYGKAATRLWIDFGLYGLGLRKIYLSTLNTDLRNVRLNEELGFRVEGILYDEVLLDGRYRDLLRMALWRDVRVAAPALAQSGPAGSLPSGP
jgi:RimJ/RimL family protein N-acetyltransferase